MHVSHTIATRQDDPIKDVIESVEPVQRFLLERLRIEQVASPEHYHMKLDADRKAYLSTEEQEATGCEYSTKHEENVV